MYEASQPIVDSNGRMTQRFRTYLQDLDSWKPIYGAGSPEGVVTAPQYRLYIRTDGTAGTSMLYVKKSADIAGDKSQGWVLV